MAAFPPVDMQIQSADPISLIRAVLKNVLASLQLTPALHTDLWKAFKNLGISKTSKGSSNIGVEIENEISFD